MLEVPTIIGLGLGFDGSANWVNKFIVDPYLLGIKSEDFNPETHSLLRKFLVIWVFSHGPLILATLRVLEYAHSDLDRQGIVVEKPCVFIHQQFLLELSSETTMHQSATLGLEAPGRVAGSCTHKTTALLNTLCTH